MDSPKTKILRFLKTVFKASRIWIILKLVGKTPLIVNVEIYTDDAFILGKNDEFCIFLNCQILARKMYDFKAENLTQAELSAYCKYQEDEKNTN